MAGNEFDLPLLLLRDMRLPLAEDYSDPSTVPVGEAWRDQVAASVVAAFRDLRDNMHVRTSSSRAMEIGFQELVASRYSGAGSPTTTQSKATALRRMEFDEHNSMHLSSELGRKKEDVSDHNTAPAPCLSLPTAACGIASSFKHSASDSEIRSNHCDVQSDFLSAFTVPRPGGDLAEGASEASNSDDADERRLQGGAQAPSDPPSSLNPSFQVPVLEGAHEHFEQARREPSSSLLPSPANLDSDHVNTTLSQLDGDHHSNRHGNAHRKNFGFNRSTWMSLHRPEDICCRRVSQVIA